jgi:hypothetical protein
MAIRPTLIPAVQGADPQILRDIQRASTATSVDFSYLVAQASQESSFQPDAKAATSSATGLYQFTKGTWLREFHEHGAKYGYGQLAQAITINENGNAHVADPALRQQILRLRKDPALSAALAAELSKENKATLEANLRRPVNNTELYLAHFLGAAGAVKLLSTIKSDPAAKAADLLPAAAEANRSVFYDDIGNARTVSQIYHAFAAKIGSHPEATAIASANGTVDAKSLALFGPPAVPARGPAMAAPLGLFGAFTTSRTPLGQRALDRLALVALQVLTGGDPQRTQPATSESVALPTKRHGHDSEPV